MSISFDSHSTRYHFDILIEEKFKTLYIHPITQVRHRITVCYVYNMTVPAAIENHLLRGPEYLDWEDKEKVLVTLFTDQLDQSPKLLPTITGFEFYTMQSGNIQWRVYEDTDEIVK